jgi:hypothetical protein
MSFLGTVDQKNRKGKFAAPLPFSAGMPYSEVILRESRWRWGLGTGGGGDGVWGQG